MITVLISWIYMAIISFVIGFLFLFPFGSKMKYEFKKCSSYMWGGLVILTVYAQFFSLFGGVGMVSNLILVLVCIIGIILFRKAMWETLKSMKPSKIAIAGIALLMLLLSYASSRGYMAYDTGLYHAQAIRWIEEVGVAPGIGLLHSRFAYNSSSFALSALFSFSFLPIEPVHAVSGFMALLLGSSSLDLFSAVKRKKLLLSDYVKIGIFYYLTLIFNEIVAPSSDFFSMLTVFYIALSWAKLLDVREKSAVPYGMLCVVSAYAISLKLSSGLLILLAIWPIVMLIKERKSKHILLYLGLGILVLLPFLIRGVIISGWLLYPTTFIDLFSVSWKIPKEAAMMDAREISAWGRGLTTVDRYDAPLKEWIIPWFLKLSVLTKGMIILDLLGFVVTIVTTVRAIWKKKSEHLPPLFLSGIVYASFFLWLFSAPLIRYGYAYIILPFLLTFGYILTRFEKLQYPVMVIAAAFLLWKTVAVGGLIYSSWRGPYYIEQMSYEEFQLQSYDVDAYTFYVPKQGDQVGYEYFPAMPYQFQGQLRGEKLRDGFEP